MEWIRPLISLIGMFGITTGFFMGRVSPEAYLGVVVVTIVWWYKSRDEEKKNGTSR